MRLFDVIGGAVVVGWAALVISYAVVINSKPPSGGGIESQQVKLTQGESWMILTRQGVDVGYIHENRTIVDDQWLLEYEMLTMLELAGIPQLIDSRMKATVDQDAVLKQFFGSVTSIIGTFEARGEVKGDEIIMTIDLQGAKREQRIKLERPPRLSTSALNQIIAGPAPRAGQIFEQEFFDPMSMGMSKMVYEFVEMKEVDSYDIKQMSYHFVQKVMGNELDVYVNDEGEILIQELPMYTVAAKVPNVLGRTRAPTIRREVEKRIKESGAMSADALLKQASAAAGERGVEAPSSGSLMRDALGFVGSAFGANKLVDDPVGYELPTIARIEGEARAWSLQSERQRLVSGEQEAARVFVGVFSAEHDASLGLIAWEQPALDEAERAALLAAPDALPDQARALVEAALKAPLPEANHDERARALTRRISMANAERKEDHTQRAPDEDLMLTQALIAAARSSSLPARYVIGVFVGPDGVALVRRWAQVWDGARFLDLDAIQEDMTAGTSHVQLWTGHAPPDKQLTDAVTRVASDGVRPHTRP